MKRLSLAAAGRAGVVTALPAAAQFQKPEDAIKYRKAAFTVMATHFGRIGAMANGRAPFDAAAAAAERRDRGRDVQAAVRRLRRRHRHRRRARAKPNVWSDNAKFDAAAKKMQDEMAKLAAAAKTGNLDQIKAAFGAAAGACKACHDDFRKE